MWSAVLAKDSHFPLGNEAVFKLQDLVKVSESDNLDISAHPLEDFTLQKSKFLLTILVVNVVFRYHGALNAQCSP